jgi:hypothetical protein
LVTCDVSNNSSSIPKIWYVGGYLMLDTKYRGPSHDGMVSDHLNITIESIWFKID